jgi:hypothetical protein
MKLNLLTIALLPISVLLFSCDVFDEEVVPNGRVTTQQATFSDYDAIDASSAFTIYLTISDNDESIEIEANDNLHQYIEVKKENGVLILGIEHSVSIRGNATLNAYITTKSVKSFMASGASRFILDQGISEEELSIYLSGASKFSGDIQSGTLYADLSGASELNLSGYTVDYKLEASGASIARDFGFTSEYFNAELSGASKANVTITKEIDVEASGASSLHYMGDAMIIHQDLSGASSVHKK